MPPPRTKVRFTPLIGGALAAIGLINVVLGLWLLFLGEFNLSLVVGLVLLALAAWQFGRAYFWLDRGPDGRVTVSGSNRNGPLGRGLTAGTGERFVVEEGLIVHVAADGSRAPAPVRRWMAHPGDWRRLAAELAGPPPGPAAPEGDAS